MTDLEARFAAVVDAPADDEPRRAYAAAIVESDPERAEFIVLQLELAAYRRKNFRSAARAAAQARTDALIFRHGERWAEDVRDLVDTWHLRRGFVDEVQLSAERFLACAPELYRRAPVLHLTLSGVAPVASALFSSPHLARIQSMLLDNDDLGDDEAVLLARSPYLGQLAWLDVSGNRIGAAGLDALAASTTLPRLTYLKFSHNAVPDPTPVHADEYETETPAAIALQAAYGPRPWLSPEGHGEWPPPRDAA